MSVSRRISRLPLLMVLLVAGLWGAPLRLDLSPDIAHPGARGAVAVVERPLGAVAVDGDPVDLVTGLFLREDDDLVVAGPPQIRLRRFYRSNDPQSRAFGIGMSHSFDHFLVGDATKYAWAIMMLSGGGRVGFVRTSPGALRADAVLEHTTSPSDFYKSRLSWSGKGWEITLQDGQRFDFPACDATTPCTMIGYRDREGRALTMTRNTAGDLTTIAAQGRGAIRLVHDTAHRITRASTEAGTARYSMTYQYDGRGRLTKAQKFVGDAAGVVREYSYDDAHRMLTVTEPGLRLTNTYDQAGRIVNQTTSQGQTFKFRYVLDGQGKMAQTDITHPDGSLRRVVFNAEGYATTDTYGVGSAKERTVTYEREAGSNRARTITVRCTAGGGPQKISAPIGARETEDDVKSRLLERCR